jgi:hypothetical protein
MNSTQIKELNLLLLKFTGFTNIKDQLFNNYATGKLMADFPKDSNLMKKLGGFRDVAPNLVTSLDAQAKWIYPILIELHIYHGFDCALPIYTSYVETFVGKRYEQTHYDPAIAFALAVKDMLDKNPELLNREEI